MAKDKPSIPKGTRDFLPVEVARRNFIFNTILDVYRLYGFKPIETPAMEHLSTLMGKYGEEGDRLIFKILNSGDFLNGVPDELLQSKQPAKIGAKICGKALRYDLTVPFARYVVQHQNDLTFPFRRYQIQPVWRADKPQKGRYREFFQCDVDIIGSDSMINEVELVNIIDDIFDRLGVNVVTKINNRKILAGIVEKIGHADKFIEFTTIIDKLEKTGIDKVNEELALAGIEKEAIEKLKPVFQMDAGFEEKINYLRKLLQDIKVGMEGVDEIVEIFDMLNEVENSSEVELDITLARGLNYYTGTIIEVKAKEVAMGSICGGGRYDDLTGIFGMEGMSGVGISFGAERIYEVMLEKGLFPEKIETFTQLLIVNFGRKEQNYCLSVAKELRKQGIQCEIYPEQAKMKKQMQYADKNNIPFVLIVGEEEMKTGMLSFKNMRTGEQVKIDKSEIGKLIVKD